MPAHGFAVDGRGEDLALAGKVFRDLRASLGEAAVVALPVATLEFLGSVPMIQHIEAGESALGSAQGESPEGRFDFGVVGIVHSLVEGAESCSVCHKCSAA